MVALIFKIYTLTRCILQMYKQNGKMRQMSGAVAAEWWGPGALNYDLYFCLYLKTSVISFLWSHLPIKAPVRNGQNCSGMRRNGKKEVSEVRGGQRPVESPYWRKNAGREVAAETWRCFWRGGENQWGHMQKLQGAPQEDRGCQLYP